MLTFDQTFRDKEHFNDFFIYNSDLRFESNSFFPSNSKHLI